MENTTQLINFPPFNESEWIWLIFLLSDTQQWMNQMIQSAFFQVPLKDRKKLFRKSYYITVTALAHILERHYYTISRHPAASKFTVPLIELLSYLRNASTEPASPIPGTLHFKRTMALDKTIGIDLDHVPTCLLTILTDAGGQIITAFPGSYKSIPNL